MHHNKHSINLQYIFKLIGSPSHYGIGVILKPHTYNVILPASDNKGDR